MAKIITLQLLINSDDDTEITDCLNAVLRDSQNDFLVDYAFGDVVEASDAVNLAIASGEYEESSFVGEVGGNIVVYSETSEFLQKPNESFNDWCMRLDIEFNKVEAISNQLTGDDIIGALISFPVADGSAIYKITSERPLTFEHVPYGDAWQVEDALLRGLTLEEVRDRIKSTRESKQDVSIKTITGR